MMTAAIRGPMPGMASPCRGWQVSSEDLYPVARRSVLTISKSCRAFNHATIEPGFIPFCKDFLRYLPSGVHLRLLSFLLDLYDLFFYIFYFFFLSSFRLGDGNTTSRRFQRFCIHMNLINSFVHTPRIGSECYQNLLCSWRWRISIYRSP